MIKHSSHVVLSLIAGLTWLLLISEATAATFHVAPSGQDSNAGGASAPWATLQHAASKVAAGDTVVVKAGKYAGFDLRKAGAKGSPITFRAEKGVVINARSPRTPDGINIEGSGHVVVEGFAIEKMPRAGARVVNSPSVTLRHNSIDGCGSWGILTGFADELVIEQNVTSRSVKEHGIYVGNTCRGPVVRGNRSWGNAGCGIHLNGDKEAGGEGVITSAVIEKNIIFDNGRRIGSGINCDGVQHSLVQNNLLYNNHASGISLYRVVGGAPSKGNRIVNNTVVMAPDGRWGLNILNGSTDNTVLNNIIMTRHSFRGSLNISTDSLPGLRSDYNVLTDRFSTDGGESQLGLDPWRSTSRQDRHSVVATPAAVFKDLDSNDFRLSATSPAVDAGTVDQAPKHDLEGNPRPRGKGFDIGALESGETAATVPPGESTSMPPAHRGADASSDKREQQLPRSGSSPDKEKTIPTSPGREGPVTAGPGLGWVTVVFVVVGAIVVFASGVGLALIIQRQAASGRARGGRIRRVVHGGLLDESTQSKPSSRGRRPSRDRHG